MFAYDKYWESKKNELKTVSSDTFLQDALKHGYFPEAGVLPDFFEADFDSSQYDKVVVTLSEKKDSLGKRRTKYEPNLFDLVKFTHTNGSGYRIYSLIHPFHYWMICKEIADNLPQIISTLTKKRNIVSYSIPNLENLEMRREDGINSWLRMAEHDLISESGEYKYLLKADISSFYASIYTHSISWAIHGRRKAKDERNNYRLLGNRLDKLAQNSNSGQTNGLPIGPVTSDILSELVLADVDEQISRRLSKIRIKYRAARYKDDYRFLAKTQEDALTIKKVLTEVLHEYGLDINQKKTDISDDIVATYAREWKKTLRSYGLDEINPKDVYDINRILDAIYHQQKLTKDYQPALSTLELLYQSVKNADIDFNEAIVDEIVAKLVHLYRLLPSSLSHCIQLIDLLLKNQSIEIKKAQISRVGGYYQKVGDDDSTAWIYRLWLQVSEEDANNFINNISDKSQMLRILKREWIFADNNYSNGGFSRNSVSLVSDALIETAQERPIIVGFRYNGELIEEIVTDDSESEPSFDF